MITIGIILLIAVAVVFYIRRQRRYNAPDPAWAEDFDVFRFSVKRSNLTRRQKRRAIKQWLKTNPRH